MKITLRQKSIKNGNKSLYLDYYDKGKREYEFLDLYLVPDDAPEARRLNTATMQKAQAIKAERTLNPDARHDKQNENAARKKANSTPKLTEWIQTVYDMKAKAGYSETVLWNTSHIKALIEEYLDYSHKRDPKIGKIEKDFIIGFLRYLQNEHTNVTYKNSVRRLTEGTLKQYQQQLVTVLNVAVKEDIIDKNPFFELNERDIFATPDSSRAYLTIDELKRFMEARYKSRSVRSVENKMAFVFACFTGLRISDIRSLSWCDIQGINGIPHVRTTMIKTKKVIFVPLSMNAMLWLPQRKEEAKDTDEVFTKLPQQSSLNDFVQRLAKAAGIEKHITFHSSRHTFATLTLKACKDLFVVSKLLGHANINTTKVYAAVLDSTMDDAIKKQDGILSNGANGTPIANTDNRQDTTISQPN